MALIQMVEGLEKEVGDYEPKGGALEAIKCREPKVLVHGPAGCGKSIAILTKLHLVALRYDGCRIAIVRKTRTSLTQSVLVTYKERVLHNTTRVKFRTNEQEFQYENGSKIVIAGLDDPSKVMSTEYDIIFVNEATEIDPGDWDALSSRLRWGRLPYQQIIGDCNPDAADHWLKRQMDDGKIISIESHYEDNPMLWNENTDDWTERGKAYIKLLDALEEPRYSRLRLGLWKAAEGIIFTEFDRNIHVIDPFDIPKEWRRFITIDFGFSNPFVAQWWAEDSDGRLYLYRELYGTERLVEDWAHEIHNLSRFETINAIICDHDAEDRATLEKHLGHDETGCYAGREKDYKMALRSRSTVLANKNVAGGIQAVKSRMKIAGDGKARIFFFRDTVVETDPKLIEAKKPASTLQEIGSYIYDRIRGGRLGDRTLEVPRKVNDHGMDGCRYMCQHLESPLHQNSAIGSIWGKSVRHVYRGR